MRPHRHTLPPAETLRGLLDYDPESGVLTWKLRPAETPRLQTWNTKYAGREAGSVKLDGYRHVAVAGRSYFAHRVIWKMHFGEEPPDQIDHINYTRADNRIANLRAATASENKANRPAQRNSRTGVKGVFSTKDRGAYQVAVHADRRRYYLGTFRTIEAAKAARDAKAREVHGEFFRP